MAAVVRGVLLHLRETAGERTAAAVKQALRTRLYRHLLVLGPGYLERRRTGELVASAVDGVEQLETYYGKYLPQLLVTVLAPIGILIYLWSLDPPLAVVMGVFLPLALLGPWLFRKATSSSGNWHWRAYASFAALVLDSLQGLPTLKAFARGKARGQEIAEQSETLYRATMRILAVNLWSTGVMDLAIAGGAAVALAVGALRAVEGHIGVGSLLIIFLLGNEVFRPVRELGRLYHQGLNGVSAAQGIFALLADQPEVVEPAHPLAPGQEALTIRFEGVTFGYDGGQRPALRAVRSRRGRGGDRGPGRVVGRWQDDGPQPALALLRPPARAPAHRRGGCPGHVPGTAAVPVCAREPGHLSLPRDRGREPPARPPGRGPGHARGGNARRQRP